MQGALDSIWQEGPRQDWWFELFELWNSSDFKHWLRKRSKGRSAVEGEKEESMYSDASSIGEDRAHWSNESKVWGSSLVRRN